MSGLVIVSSCSRGDPVPSAAAARDKEETPGPSLAQLACEYTCTYLSSAWEDRVLKVEYSWGQSTKGWCQTEYCGLMSDRVLESWDWCRKEYCGLGIDVRKRTGDWCRVETVQCTGDWCQKEYWGLMSELRLQQKQALGKLTGLTRTATYTETIKTVRHNVGSI